MFEVRFCLLCVWMASVLNKVAGYHIICCVCTSIHGLRQLLMKCEEYASTRGIIFNHTKTVGVMLHCHRN